jgi:hypothetical protein
MLRGPVRPAAALLAVLAGGEERHARTRTSRHVHDLARTDGARALAPTHLEYNMRFDTRKKGFHEKLKRCSYLERERHRQTGRQSDRVTETERQRDRDTHRYRVTQTEMQTETETEIQKQRYGDIDRDTETKIQRQRNIDKDIYRQRDIIDMERFIDR